MLGLPLGKKSNIAIPECIAQNPRLMKACIRGIADTDGSINLGQRKSRRYPRIFITNTSEPLMLQIRDFLVREGFRVQYWSHPQKDWLRIHKIAVNGPTMLAQWMKRIGFHNPKHVHKAQEYEGIVYK